MKKITVLTLVALLLAGGAAIAERSTFIGLGYSQDANAFTSSSNVKSLSTSGLALSIDTFRAPGQFPLGFTASIVGTMPGQMDISLNGVAQTPLTSLTYAYAVDSCFGLGYHLNFGLPISVYAGVGLAMDILAVSNDDDSFFGVSYGLGGSLSARFDFLSGIGVVATVRDNFCPWNLAWLSDSVGSGYTFANANNFSASLGFAFGK